MAFNRWTPKRIAVLCGDIFGLLTIAGLVCGIHVLVPRTTRGQLALDHADPTLVTMWSSAFVHYSWAHLVGNIIAYGLAIVPAWVLAVRQQSRLNFWTCVLVVLIVFPLPLGFATDLAFERLFRELSASVSMGFSGVVGGYVGVLFGFLTSYLAVRFDLRAAMLGTLVILLSLFGLLLETYPTTGLRWLKAILFTAIFIGIGFLTVSRRHRSDQTGGSAIVTAVSRHRLAFGLILCCWVALGVLVPLLFPHPSASAGYVPNVVAHTLGLGGGYLLAVSVQFGRSQPSGHVSSDAETSETAGSPSVTPQPTSVGCRPHLETQFTLTRSIVPERFPPEHVPVETARSFVRPVVKHRLEIESTNSAGPLPIRLGVHRIDSSGGSQSWTGTVTLSGRDGRTQSTTVDIATTYLTTTFFPARHLLDPRVERIVSDLGVVEFSARPNGTLATRPPGTPEQLRARTYSWLGANAEHNPEHQPQHSGNPLPEGQYVVTAHAGQNECQRWQSLERFEFEAQSHIVAIARRWPSTWDSYQPLVAIVRHLLNRKM
ncbi:hypothetical protein [Halorussus marinus]|uniref:hypothetical protein n=1 Tax=Halorussus marinus TaxID=2505976 RepID=UPI00109199F0|nr:hypothetical protein [Halorussus marinus]